MYYMSEIQGLLFVLVFVVVYFFYCWWLSRWLSIKINSVVSDDVLDFFPMEFNLRLRTIWIGSIMLWRANLTMYMSDPFCLHCVMCESQIIRMLSLYLDFWSFLSLFSSLCRLRWRCYRNYEIVTKDMSGFLDVCHPVSRTAQTQGCRIAFSSNT